MNYKIYYADEDAWTESGIKPYSGKNLPNTPEKSRFPSIRGIVAIVQGDPTVGWYICTGADYYIERKGRWYGVDFFAMLEHLNELGLVRYAVGYKRIRRRDKWIDVDMVSLLAFIEETELVLFGRMISSEEYYAIMQRVEDDREFAKRSGTLPYITSPYRVVNKSRTKR